MKKHKLLPDTKEIKESADLIQAAIDIENAAYDTFLKDTLKARQTGNKTEYEKAKQSFLEAGKKADKLRLKANEIWEAYPGINPMHMNLQGYTPAEQRDNLISMVDKDMDKLTDTSVNLPIPTELPEEEPIYHLMFHGFGTDCLAQISPREKSKKDYLADTATYNDTNYIFTLEGYDKLIQDEIKGLRLSTQKLLHALIIGLTCINSKGNNNPQETVTIDLEEYIGKDISESNRKRKCRRIREDLDILYSLNLNWKEHTGNPEADKDGRVIDMRILSYKDVSTRNGWITVDFTKRIVNYFVNSYMMYYPENLLKIDDRNPCAYHLGWYLAIYHSIPNNQKRGTANIISIKALLDANHDIPSEEEVRQSGRHYYHQRIEPLCKALDTLVDVRVLKKWGLCNAKGEPLSKSQQNRKDYRSTLKLYVYFEFADNKKFNQYIEQLKQPKIETKQRRSKKQRKD